MPSHHSRTRLDLCVSWSALLSPNKLPQVKTQSAAGQSRPPLRHQHHRHLRLRYGPQDHRPHRHFICILIVLPARIGGFVHRHSAGEESGRIAQRGTRTRDFYVQSSANSSNFALVQKRVTHSHPSHRYTPTHHARESPHCDHRR